MGSPSVVLVAEKGRHFVVPVGADSATARLSAAGRRDYQGKESARHAMQKAQKDEPVKKYARGATVLEKLLLTLLQNLSSHL